jgi:guanylate kinase
VMNRLIVISAPSGAGKTTLCTRLLADFSNDLVLSISSTTRAPRGQEKHGVHYFFLTQEDFKKGAETGAFAEWALVHGNYYGTSRELIESTFGRGKSVLLDIDVQGADQLKKAYEKQCFRIFVAPPSMTELEKRLRTRGTDTEETIQRRLKNAREENARSRDFDSVVVNDDFERAYTELKKLVEGALRG